jgi:hypothetical protein
MSANATPTHRAACPVCDRGPRDKAMKVTTDERGTVAYCHRCGHTECQNHERPHIEPVRTTSTSNIPLDECTTPKGVSCISCIEPTRLHELHETGFGRVRAFRAGGGANRGTTPAHPPRCAG